jgi:hypothetical protein
MSAAMQMAVHAEYKLPEEVDRSLHLLHHKFGATSGPGAESHNA